MSESGDTPRSGWWWRFIALFLGVPPVAVWAAEEEVEDERAQAARARESAA